MTNKEQKTNLTGVAWAIACDLRRNLDKIRFLKWPNDGLTRSEKRHLLRMMGYLDQAQAELLRLQGSLAERSKLSGEENPNYTVARNLNDNFK